MHFEQATNGLIFIVDGAALYDAFSDYTIHDFIFNVLLVFIRGCATEKGIARIDEFIKRHRTQPLPVHCSKKHPNTRI